MNDERILSIGKRKTAKAEVSFFPGKGNITINGIDIIRYYC